MYQAEDHAISVGHVVYVWRFSLDDQGEMNVRNGDYKIVEANGGKPADDLYSE